MNDTPAPVTPRTERDRLFDEVDRRFGRNVARFVDARLDAIAGLEKSSTSFEREAAAPAATEPQGYAPGHSPNCAIPNEHKGPHEWPGPRPIASPEPTPDG